MKHRTWQLPKTENEITLNKSVKSEYSLEKPIIIGYD